MPASTPVILGWARSPVAPHGGAFKGLMAHEIAAPVIHALLARVGVRPDQIDAVVAGNALAAGGNPARMAALAAGLPDRCAALTIDTQCCAGLDAVSVAVGLLASGAATMVLAGGVEAWSRAPIRQHRPLAPGQLPESYERPAFAPDPRRDPDMLVAAAAYAQRLHHTRLQQDAYALVSHARACADRDVLAHEIVPVAGLVHDSHPRQLTAKHAARMPAATLDFANEPDTFDCTMSRLAVSPRADGAAFLVMTTAGHASELGIEPAARWLAGATVGAAPEVPMLAAIDATRLALDRASLSMDSLAAIELHDAFAVQALAFAQSFSIDPFRMNCHGGGLARGHPIGASGAICLVRVLSDLCRTEAPGACGLAAVAGAGGVGAAAVVQRL